MKNSELSAMRARDPGNKRHSLVLFIVHPHNTRLRAPQGMELDPGAERLSVADQRDKLEQGARLHYPNHFPSPRVSERLSPIVSVIQRLDVWRTLVVKVKV